MTDRTVTRNEDLTMPERAALDVWTSGSPDTTGMLCAVRAALRAHGSTEDARLAIAEKALRDLQADNERLTRELAEAREHTALDRQAIVTLREREQQSWKVARELRDEVTDRG